MQTDYLCHEEIRQRVTLVRALAIESEILLLDELFTAFEG